MTDKSPRTQPILVTLSDRSAFDEALRLDLNVDGYTFLRAHDAKEAKALCRRDHVAMILIDMDREDARGTEVCRQLHLSEPTFPAAICLGESEAEVDKIVAFELGATDYLAMPYNRRELTLRVKVILRRHHQAPRVSSAPRRLGPLELDERAHHVTVEGHPIDLTPREFQVLRHLIIAQGRVLRRDELVSLVWGDDTPVVDRVVDVCVMRVRRKLGVASQLLETVRGIGYRLRDQGLATA